MVMRLAFGEERPVCTACGYVHFHDPKVAAVTFVQHQHRVLLVKRSMNPEKGKWALPAGYVNGNEDPRAAAVRETLEETGLQVNIVRLIDVLHNPPQSDGSHSGASIVILYEASLIGGRLQAQDDVEDAAWFTFDQLPELAFKSTWRAIEDWQHNHPHDAH